MQIDITGHHVDVTPALRAYVTEKMQKIMRHSDQVISIRVILNVEKLQQLAEATVNVAGRTVFATVTATDMYASIDGLVDKLDRQIRRRKDRSTSHEHIRHAPVSPEGGH
jgi:putative sigma-54 modulation protein